MLSIPRSIKLARQYFYARNIQAKRTNFGLLISRYTIPVVTTPFLISLPAREVAGMLYSEPRSTGDERWNGGRGESLMVSKIGFKASEIHRSKAPNNPL